MEGASTPWETRKALFRGQCISERSCLKRDAAAQKTSLLTKLRSAEHRFVCSSTVAHLRAMTFLREQLKSIMNLPLPNLCFGAKQTFYEFSNKPHRMLVAKLNFIPFTLYLVFCYSLMVYLPIVLSPWLGYLGIFIVTLQLLNPNSSSTL